MSRLRASSLRARRRGRAGNLGNHLTEAGLPEKAAGYWLRAGKIAGARFANLEAIAHLRRGIEAVSGFPDGASKDRLELDLQFALGPSLIATQGFLSKAFDHNLCACSRAL
jgi:predicted ATPase